MRDATSFGPEPPQVAPPQVPMDFGSAHVTNEDCLNLNLWTPDPGAVGLPVMMWIQGGMFDFTGYASAWETVARVLIVIGLFGLMGATIVEIVGLVRSCLGWDERDARSTVPEP